MAAASAPASQRRDREGAAEGRIHCLAKIDRPHDGAGFHQLLPGGTQLGVRLLVARVVVQPGFMAAVIRGRDVIRLIRANQSAASRSILPRVRQSMDLTHDAAS